MNAQRANVEVGQMDLNPFNPNEARQMGLVSTQFGVFSTLCLTASALVIYSIVHAARFQTQGGLEPTTSLISSSLGPSDETSSSTLAASETTTPALSEGRERAGLILLATGASAMSIVLIVISFFAFEARSGVGSSLHVLASFYVAFALLFMIGTIVYSRQLVETGYPSGVMGKFYAFASAVMLVLIVATGAFMRKRIEESALWLAVVAFVIGATAFGIEWPWWSAFIVGLFAGLSAALWVGLSPVLSLTVGCASAATSLLVKLLDDEHKGTNRGSMIGLIAGFFGVCAMLLAGIAIVARRRQDPFGFFQTTQDQFTTPPDFEYHSKSNEVPIIERGFENYFDALDRTHRQLRQQHKAREKAEEKDEGHADHHSDAGAEQAVGEEGDNHHDRFWHTDDQAGTHVV